MEIYLEHIKLRSLSFTPVKRFTGLSRNCYTVPVAQRIRLCFLCFDSVQWIYIQGMDFAANCVEHRVLIFGHSYVKRIGSFCRARGLANLGLPPMYHVELVGLSGATSQAFELWAASIVNFKPELLIVDLGGNDVARSSCPVNELAAELLLHLRKILDHLPAYLFTWVVILEQHKRSRVPSAMLHHSLYNLRLQDWHLAIAALHRIDDRISFQRLRGCNGPRWYRELTDGVHLTNGAQWAYLTTLQYIIRMAYHS